jgi:signal transduction histidine kinase/CheY-like chemotaxis protein
MSIIPRSALGLLRSVAVFLFVQTALANDYLEIGLPVVERFDAEQHQGSNQNWWLLQGKNGYIYNGTGRGLTQWDGERWHFYPSPNRTLLRAISQWRDDRLYTGSMNDVGYYQADPRGRLSYYSLVAGWSFEQRQFGEVWSTASNRSGVLFVADKHMLFYDGAQLHILDDLPNGNMRVFAIGDTFYFKAPGQPEVQTLTMNGDQSSVAATGLMLPAEASVQSLFINQKGNLVLATIDHGVYEQQQDQLVSVVAAHQFADNATIYSAIQASDGYYYITTLYAGVYILGPDLELLRRFGKEHDLGSDKFYSVMEDVQGNIWLAGVPDIVKFIPPHVYSRYRTDSDLANKIALLQGKVTVTSDGLFQLRSADIPIEPPVFEQLLSDVRLSWDFVEFEGHVFHAGYAGIVAYPMLADGELGIPVKVLEGETGKAFALTRGGNALFASTNEALHLIRYRDQQFTVDPVPGAEDEITVLALDDDGVLWAGTPTQELYRIENALAGDGSVLVEKFTAEDGLGPNNVVPHKLDHGMVIGTHDGLMDFDAKRTPQLQFVRNHPSIFNTPGQDVFRLHQDHLNRLWYRIGAHTGVAQQDKEGVWHADETVFGPFKDNGYKGFLVTSDNVLWFISAKGEVFRVNIDRASDAPTQGKLNIRQISDVNSDEVIYGGMGNAGLPQLNQRSNSLRFTFALAENSDANAAYYRHRLVGADNESWSKWGRETSKDFTQLPGGDYSFEVEGRDGWGRVSSAKLPFYVLPPWYLSTAAWVAYGLALVLLLLAIGWLTQRWRTRVLQQRNLELEQQVALRTADVQEKARQLKQQQVQKDRFFANVSHEFRTPITLTIAPLQEILKSSEPLQPEMKQGVGTALRNAQKMLSLLGQILDINKLESQNFKLRVAENDLAAAVRNACERFTPWIAQHDQTLISSGLENPVSLYFDQEQIERCFSNLLSNAVKYSGTGSTINISLIEERANFVGVSVQDNGPGIDPESEHRVFERYYQGKSSEQVSEPGTGIGLALVDEIMRLHHGAVELVNQPGQGCQFILWLNKDHNHFSQDQLLDRMEANIFQSEEAGTDLIAVSAEASGLPDLPAAASEQDDVTSLLVVDDNAELRHFVSLKLASSFRIYQACNGREGLAAARNKLPDLIISDVMMPIMDGIEMTRQIKSDPLTDTISVILLTAKATKRETVAGLTAGADDYLTKPFDTSELIARVNAIINSRKSIRARISAELERGPNAVHNFADKVRLKILDHLSEPGFSAEQLADSLAMSPRNLRRKCREELDKSVVQAITTVRMEVALDLLQSTERQISEVAYATGFESLAYFSRTFKKYYGFTPTARQTCRKQSG